MEISKKKILDLAEREIRMYDSMFGSPAEIKNVGWEMRYGSDNGKIALVVTYKDGIRLTLFSGNDLDEIMRSYLDDLKTVWGTESLEEIELLMESRGF